MTHEARMLQESHITRESRTTHDTAVGFQSIRAESRLEACMTHKSHMLQQSCMALA